MQNGKGKKILERDNLENHGLRTWFWFWFLIRVVVLSSFIVIWIPI